MTARLRELLVVAPAALLLPAAAWGQCAMCGTAIQGQDDPLARGLFWSVVFLISLPYTIVGGLVLTFVILHRRAARGFLGERSGATARRREQGGLRLVPERFPGYAGPRKENRT
ncbi:MAG: hypothetical protein QOD06_2621 [Candidatus Binatota bacterium]|jgi:hypothetical protein|nr:hypothetical protein [Candidatus Binatota bacterium]